MERISDAARRRLVTIASLLARSTEERITSVRIQEVTGFSRDLVRKDISLIGFSGGVSNGYDVKSLLDAIGAALGISFGASGRPRFCCIAGLGKLGAALMQCGMFDDTPFKIKAGFDSRVNRTEVLSADFPLYPAAKMESVIPESGIEFAILAVEDDQAQLMASRLVQSGIKGIVNFTGEILTVPESVRVENVSPVLALNNMCAQCFER